MYFQPILEYFELKLTITRHESFFAKIMKGKTLALETV